MILAVAAVAAELADLPGEALGIGAVAAGARLARILATRRPEAVVLVGSAGAYPGGPAVGTACRVRRVGLADGAAALGRAYVPRPPAPIACDRELLADLDLPWADALTVGAVTTDPTLAAALARGWQLEHLEAWGAALACREAGVPFAAVLGVANLVGPTAHEEWRANRALAEAVAREAVAALLS